MSTFGRNAKSGTSSDGGDSTHCRTGASGNTRAIRWAVRSCILRAAQLKQTTKLKLTEMEGLWAKDGTPQLVERQTRRRAANSLEQGTLHAGLVEELLQYFVTRRSGHCQSLPELAPKGGTNNRLLALP